MEAYRPDLVALLRAGVEAADPAAAVRRVVSADNGSIEIDDNRLTAADHVHVLALGKAAIAMVDGLDEALPGVPLYGLAVAPAGRSGVRGMITLHGTHPVPSRSSVIAGRRLLAAAALVPETIPTVVLISGGGSALAEALAPGVTLDWVAAATEYLLRSGAAIEELNAIRRHVSLLKGGGLAAALRGPHVTVALSDVVGSAHHDIASGPTVADPVDHEEAVRIAARYRLDLPTVALPPKATREAPFVIAADGAVVAAAVVAAGREAGLNIVLHTTELRGEATDSAALAIETTEPGTLGVFAGETTVTVTGNGTGGRNQEAALAAALVIEGTATGFAALGTDGIDGTSPAAGAVVDGETLARIRAKGLDAATALAMNDSFTVLDAVGATIMTGPTGTNVGDIWVVDRTAEPR